jgi:hypothetical protein
MRRSTGAADGARTSAGCSSCPRCSTVSCCPTDSCCPALFCCPKLSCCSTVSCCSTESRISCSRPVPPLSLPLSASLSPQSSAALPACPPSHSIIFISHMPSAIPAARKGTYEQAEQRRVAAARARARAITDVGVQLLDRHQAGEGDDGGTCR